MTTGRVEALFTAPADGEPMRREEAVEAVEGPPAPRAPREAIREGNATEADLYDLLSTV